MRIMTMATGGIGGYLAVRLSQAGHEVACIARGAHLDAIQRDGLALEIPWINGAIARLGAQAGVPTPVNATLNAVLAPYALGASGQPG